MKERDAGKTWLLMVSEASTAERRRSHKMCWSHHISQDAYDHLHLEARVETTENCSTRATRHARLRRNNKHATALGPSVKEPRSTHAQRLPLPSRRAARPTCQPACATLFKPTHEHIFPCGVLEHLTSLFIATSSLIDVLFRKLERQQISLVRKRPMRCLSRSLLVGQ